MIPPYGDTDETTIGFGGNMQMGITALYAGLLGVLLLVLSYRVSMYRRRHGISLGDGGHKGLHTAIRVQGNFVEYVPTALILLLLVELTGRQPAIVHGLGAALFLGRVLHAQGLTSNPDGKSPGRLLGILLTWTMLLTASVLLILGSAAGI